MKKVAIIAKRTISFCSCIMGTDGPTKSHQQLPGGVLVCLVVRKYCSFRKHTEASQRDTFPPWDQTWARWIQSFITFFKIPFNIRSVFWPAIQKYPACTFFNSSFYYPPPPPCSLLFPLFGPDIFLIVFSYTPNIFSSLRVADWGTR
jgi:hypothetical protein